MLYSIFKMECTVLIFLFEKQLFKEHSLRHTFDFSNGIFLPSQFMFCCHNFNIRQYFFAVGLFSKFRGLPFTQQVIESANPFAKFRSDVENVKTSQNTFQQCSCSLMFFKIVLTYKFPDICKIISVLESLFDKVTCLMACNFIRKQTPAQLFSCEYHKMFENGFLYGRPPVAASENG